MVGPNPIANSFTFTLQNFATMKCPASWIRIRKPNKNMIFSAFRINVSKNTQLPPNFYSSINRKYAKGAMNMTLSILSSKPPCPGIRLLKSLIPT